MIKKKVITLEVASFLAVVDSLFSPRGSYFLRVVGLFFRMEWGPSYGGHFWSCPPDIFLREPLVTVFTAQIFIIFPDRGALHFFRDFC